MLPCGSKILWEAGPPKVPNIPIKIPLGEFYLWILINNNTLKQQLFHIMYLNIRQILTNSYVVFCCCFKMERFCTAPERNLETAASQHSDTWHQTFFSTNSDQRLPLLIFDAWTFCLDGSAVIVSFLFDASGISQLQADYGQEAS